MDSTKALVAVTEQGGIDWLLVFAAAMFVVVAAVIYKLVREKKAKGESVGGSHGEPRPPHQL